MNKLLLTALGTISIVLGTSSLTNAASLSKTDFSLTFAKPPANYSEQPLGICSFIGICKPGVESISLDLNPGISTPPLPFINDTGFPITGVFARLPETRPEGPARFVNGTSDIFSNIGISNDEQRLSFTNGIIAVNEIIFADYEIDPENDSTLFLTLTTSTATPEPSSLIGVLMVNLLGINLWFQRKK